ncbi:MAG: hypothetical protein RL662_2392 [Bacteroidota bacterium]|jgi:tRNA(Arg) A34 adenosine deaminase TadA
MKNGLIRESLRIARSKLSSHSQFFNFPHFSFIIQNNKIIEWKTNSNAIPAIHLGYKLDGGMSKTHAEVNAYRAAKGLLNQNKPFEIVNLRLNRQGEIRMSAPCKCCFTFLQTMGCSQCWFSTDFGMAKIGM